jgi:hypothetical protein
VSIRVEPTELAERLRDYGWAYLATVGAEPRAHLVAVHPALVDGVLRIPDLGRTSRRNAGLNPELSLVWPPADPGGYSLIVDGTAVPDGDELLVTPTRAVLHRPAPTATDPTAAEPGDGRCASDCVELPV